MNVQTYRLAESDETAIIARVRDTLKGWVRQHDGGKWYGATDHETLERVGLHAICCTVHDMRDSELEWLSRTVALIAADVFAGASDFAAWKVTQ
jgi:hypothetical protein